MTPHDKDKCPYCAIVILAGRGIRDISNELFDDEEERKDAIIKVSLHLLPALELLDAQCFKDMPHTPKGELN